MADLAVAECVKVGKLMMKSEVPYLPFDDYGKRGMSHLLINSGLNLSILMKWFYGHTLHIDEPNNTRKIENRLIFNAYHNYLKVHFCIRCIR